MIGKWRQDGNVAFLTVDREKVPHARHRMRRVTGLIDLHHTWYNIDYRHDHIDTTRSVE